ncbi:hypothetical protein Tco_0204218 [Tanacetum coccineum]
MSEPANDDYSQHLSDDEASYHEDASDNEKKNHRREKDGVVRILPPVSAVEINVVEKERKARNILLMAIPKEHLRRFHGMDDSKEIWEAIRTSLEGLEKGYDRFQQLLSQLEAHGAEVLNLRSKSQFSDLMPPAWSKSGKTMENQTRSRAALTRIDDIDIEKMDINWKIAMIAIQMKKFYKRLEGESGLMETNLRIGMKAVKEKEQLQKTVDSWKNSSKNLWKLVDLGSSTQEHGGQRRDLDQLTQKHLREVTTDKATSTNSVNSSSEPANTKPVDQDDSDMPELTTLTMHHKGFFDEAS